MLYLLQFNMRYDTGFELGLIAFTAAVLGGIGNLSGAVLGAIVIGFIQAFNEGLTWYTPGQRLDALDRVRDPDRDPRLPARGPAGRADARGRMNGRSASSTGVQPGEPPLDWRTWHPAASGAIALAGLLYPNYVETLQDCAR